jgi:hypothetical protein
VFADEEDAKLYAEELRGGGARAVKVGKQMHRPRGAPPMYHAPQGRPPGVPNPSHRKFRDGTRVVFRPTPASRMMYRFAPADGATGVVVSIPLPGGRGSFLPGPGGGLVYVDWDLYETQGVSPADLEVDQVIERAKRVAGIKRNAEETHDTDILEGMARAIWVTSWASWLEELSKDERRELGQPVSLSGVDLDEAAPESPASALAAAEDLYLLIERANAPKDVGELFQKACEADGCAWNAENADLFGHYLAMQAMGEGVSWFDDHEAFPLKMPPRGFEAHYDDGDVWWSPQVKSRQNGRHR